MNLEALPASDRQPSRARLRETSATEQPSAVSRAAPVRSQSSTNPGGWERGDRAFSRGQERLFLGLTLLAYVLLAAGYVVLTPPWENPDEPAHFNYVAFVAQTGGLPELKPGDWDSELLERVKTGTLFASDSLSSIRYESWQPPLVYLLAAPVYLVGPSDPLATLQRLRAFDAVIGGLTLVVAYGAARHVQPPRVALAVPATMVGIPMFTAISAGLSADPLANLLAATLVLLLLRELRAPTTANTLVIGVVLGLGLLAKLALAIFIPLALGVVLLRARDNAQLPRALDNLGPTRAGDNAAPIHARDKLKHLASEKLKHVAVLLVTPGVVLVPWLAHQVTTYGWRDPLATARHAAVVADQPRFVGFTPDYLWGFLTVSFHSFWAQFGWMAIVATPRVYWTFAVFTVAALIGLLRTTESFEQPSYRLLAAAVLAGVLAYIGYNLTFDQPQGRYLFPALVPIAIFFTLGWHALIPNRARSWGLPLIVALLVAHNAYVLLRILVPGFNPPTL